MRKALAVLAAAAVALAVGGPVGFVLAVAAYNGLAR
jgi:precorrin isomerase